MKNASYKGLGELTQGELPARVKQHSKSLDWLFFGACIGGFLMIFGGLSLGQGHTYGAWVLGIGFALVVCNAFVIPRAWKRWMSAWRAALNFDNH